jgi:hypothetical protein
MNYTYYYVLSPLISTVFSLIITQTLIGRVKDGPGVTWVPTARQRDGGGSRDS